MVHTLLKETLAVALYVRQLYTFRVVCARQNTTADHERYVAFVTNANPLFGPAAIEAPGKLFEIEANNLIALSGRPLTVQLFA